MSFPVYLALGSNQGDRLQYLFTAVRGLFPRAPVSRVSSVYETPPWGYLNQPAFLNMVVEVQTSLEPRALLDLLKSIESKMGRVKTILNGPRLIDMDILFYESQIYQDDSLTVPHPRMRGRGFVLRPMADLAPDFLHPQYNLSISVLLGECDLNGITAFTSASEFEDNLAPDRYLLAVEAAQAFNGNDQAAKIFNQISPSHQREYIRFVSDAKKADTRRRRAQKMLTMLAEKDKSQ